MLFSIGDLITFVVVLLILVVFRSMDKNNRSIEKLKRFSDKIIENLSAFVEGKTGEIKDLSLDLQANLKTGKEMLTRVRGVEEFLQSRTSDIDAIQKRLTEYDQALAELTSMSARVDQNLKRIHDESEFVDEVGKRILESSGRLDAIEKQVPQLTAGFAEQARNDLRSARDQLLGEVDGKVGALHGQLDQAEAKVKDFSTYIARLEARGEQMERDRVASLTKQLDSFEAAIRQKLAVAAQRGETLEGEVFEKLAERIQADETSVAKAMEGLEQRIADYQGDADYKFKALEEAGADIEALRGSLAQAMERAAADVRSQMKSLAAQLSGEWQAEIAGATATRQRVEEGMAEVADGLAQLKTKAYQDVESKLTVFEDEYFADLRERSAGTQEKVRVWQEELEKRVAELESDVKQRIGASDESLQSLRETLRAETERARKDAATATEKELASVKDALDAGTRKLRRDIDSQIKELTDAFASERDDLVSASGEERTALRSELAQMSQRLGSFGVDLQKTIDAAMESFRAQSDAFQAESQKRMRDAQAEVEGEIKDYRQLLADSREKAEAMQERTFGKIDESSRVLSASLAEIDKRVKNFMGQTRIFERADTMKATLEGTIDEMKKEMAKLNSERAEITEIEVQLSRTRKLAEEVSVKLTRFLAEKRRIDEMDSEFKKIMTISRDVDLKLDSLSTSNDALQQIQAKVRQFEDMGKAVEGGFEKLEKKREILSVTQEGVDRNFQRLENIEKALQDASRSTEEIAGRLESLKGDYDLLASNKKDAESTLETVAKLSSITGELEQRLDKAQSAREWLARTETRFQEVAREAAEQVRLMETLVKAETKKEKGDRGAPPMDKRETVVKLSHQGWSVPEISKVTQLSRGEVELILELAPKV